MDNIKIVDRVMNGLFWDKDKLIDMLFPDSVDRYKNSWRELEAPMFWARLDLDNRDKVLSYLNVQD